MTAACVSSWRHRWREQRSGGRSSSGSLWMDGPRRRRHVRLLLLLWLLLLLLRSGRLPLQSSLSFRSLFIRAIPP